MLLIFTMVAGLSLGLFLHPYITYPLSLLLVPRRPVQPSDKARPLSAAIFFCAFNEERSLPDKIANLEAIRTAWPDIAIYAYDDASTDGTNALLAARGDLITLVTASQRAGKATGMRRMVEAAVCDICIFTDANVILPPESIGPLLDAFRDPAVGGVSGKLRYLKGDSTTARVGGLYWRLEEMIKALESRSGSMMGADGSIFATRRSRYPGVPPHLLDDMIVSISVLFHHMRLVSGRGVIAYEKSTSSSAEEFARKRRIACRAYNTHRYLWPKLRQRLGGGDLYKYISHKWLRWMGAPLLASTLIFGSLALALAGQLTVLGVIWIAGIGLVLLGGLVRLPLLSSLYEIGKAIVATFVGITDSWNGRRYQTWAPAKSRN